MVSPIYKIITSIGIPLIVSTKKSEKIARGCIFVKWPIATKSISKNPITAEKTAIVLFFEGR